MEKIVRKREIACNRRNCLLQAISPVLTMFSTALNLWCVKMEHCVVMRFKCEDLVKRLVIKVNLY